MLSSLNLPVDPTAIPVARHGEAADGRNARAVRLKAKIIIFDEPTATLTPKEKHHLFALIDRLRRDQVRSSSSAPRSRKRSKSPIGSLFSATATVLCGRAKTFSRETIIRHMVGRSLTDELYRPSAEARSHEASG